MIKKQNDKLVVNSRTAVKVISKKEKTALVEYFQDDDLHRRYIPANEIGDGNVLDEVLQQGIPYGYPWEEIELKFDAKKLSYEMHKVGIWTEADALKFSHKVWSALNATYAVDISKILKVASLENRRKT